jgi:hypothetical protein
LPGTVDQASFFEEDGVEHRVEPPSWLPEGAAPEGDGPDPSDSTVSAETPADKAPAGNGQDGTATFRYSHDGSYTDSQDGSVESNQDAPAAEYADNPSANGTQDEAFGASHDSTFVSGQQATLGGGAQDKPYGGTDHGGYRAQQDDAFGSSQNGTQDGAYGSAQDGAYGSTQGSAYGGGQDGMYGSDSAYGSDRGPYAGTDGVSDRDLTPEQAWQRRTEPPGTTTYSARMLAEPTGVTDPVSEAAGAATGAYGYTPAPTPAAPVRSRKGKGRPRAAVAQSTGQSAVQPRRANLVIARLEPWSVMKFSFLISLVAWIVLFVAVGILYYALSGLGVFDALQKTLTSVTSSQGSAGVSLSKWTSASRVLGYTMLIGAVNVVLITALSTVGAMIYNLVTHLGGGIEVTLKETD